jgi:hypothetical protein
MKKLWLLVVLIMPAQLIHATQVQHAHTANAITAKYETIELGSVELHLGEQKADVLARLVTAGYTTQPLSGDGNSFAVLRQQDKTWQFFGSLAFTAGRLTFISKDWTPTSSAYDLANAIFFATKNLKDRGCRFVILDPEENDQPAYQARTVYVSCVGSNRRFEIDTLHIDYPSSSNPPGNPEESATLLETLEDRSAAR